MEKILESRCSGKPLCIHFLELSWQSTTNLVASRNRSFFSLTVLEAWSQSQGVCGAVRPCSPKSLQETMLLFLFKLLGAPGVPQLMHTPLQSLLPSSHGLPLCVSLMKTPVMGFSIHPESRMSLGHVIDTSAKTLFSSKITFHWCWGLGLGHVFWEDPGGSDSKESACNLRDSGLIPGSGRSPREGNDISLQYSCVKYPMDRGAWWATVHWDCRVRYDWVTHFHFEEILFNSLHPSFLNPLWNQDVKVGVRIIHADTLFCAEQSCCLLAKSCPTLCDLMDCSPSGFFVPGILQARILEWLGHFLLQGRAKWEVLCTGVLEEGIGRC